LFIITILSCKQKPKPSTEVDAELLNDAKKIFMRKTPLVKPGDTFHLPEDASLHDILEALDTRDSLENVSKKKHNYNNK